MFRLVLLIVETLSVIGLERVNVFIGLERVNVGVQVGIADCGDSVGDVA